MSEDMSNIMNQLNNMIKNNEIPNEIKNLMNSMTGGTQNGSEYQTNSNTSSNTSSNESSSSPEFDMATIMKMKQVMDSMRSSKDDPRTNLLKSLKPYLKESRKEKVDQYIQLFGMGKMFEMLGSLNGEVRK